MISTNQTVPSEGCADLLGLATVHSDVKVRVFPEVYSEVRGEEVQPVSTRGNSVDSSVAVVATKSI